MLILTRKIGEKIAVGDNITIALLDIKGGQVKIGIDAPKEISVHREEIYKRIRNANLKSSEISASDLSKATSLYYNKKRIPEKK